MVYSSPWGKRSGQEDGGPNAERRALRHGLPLDRRDAPLRRTWRPKGGSHPLPPRVHRLVVRLQPGASSALVVVPRLRARRARPRDSDKPECCYTVDDFSADVDAFMDEVGIKEATLVGDSLGGIIAQRVALDYPHRVSRLVLIGSPTTLLNNEVVMEAGEMMRALEDPISPEFVREFHMSTIYHPVPEEFLSTALSETLKVPARIWRGYMEGVVLKVDDTARLGEIEAPT